jgi:hypothetical protein
MRLEINRLEGLRNDLLLRLERSEIEEALLNVAGRARLMASPGMPRHRDATRAESEDVAECKVTIDEHLRQLGILDSAGRLQRRAVAISNRNLGTNHGHIAWQRSATPPIFRTVEDPCNYSSHSCFVAKRDGGVGIMDLRFDLAGQRIFSVSGERDLSDEIEWATFGQRVLRAGQVTCIEAIVDQFYDLRHVLAFDPNPNEGEAIRDCIYEGYPENFRENARRALRVLGAPRARYFHNAIGCSDDAVFIVQREGTVEEIGAALREAGADDGIILDNGGSVACWAWWLNQYRGGLVSPTVDYRPPGTSAIAFILKGSAHTQMPGGSVSYSVL